MTTDNALSRVPHDVERLIVEDAMKDLVWSVQGGPFKIPALLLTCQRYTAWSYPVLYRSIRLGNQRATRLLRTLTDSPSLASFVRILVFIVPGMGERDYNQVLIDLISKCRNLTRLCTWDTHWSESYDFSCLLSLTHLSCHPYILWQQLRPQPPPGSDRSPLRSVTHLDISMYEIPFRRWLPTIAKLPSLTHLMLGVQWLDAEVIEEIDSLLTLKLRACVVCLDNLFTNGTEIQQFRAMGARDPRFVLALNESVCDQGITFPCIRWVSSKRIASEWTSFHCGPDIWEEAENIIQARSASA